MKIRNFTLVTLALMFMSLMLLSCTSPAAAPEVEKDAPLFINLTSDDPHRVNMALSFGMKQLDRGHPLTIFLNDKGVYVGSTANAGQFAEQQKTIAALVEKGAVVFICPMCMEHYGIQESDLLPGLKVSDPDSIGEYLFKPKTRTLNW
jgi:sulfur relay (sulfurtransferase) complex TusBCD TusD component (DsrE family)